MSKCDESVSRITKILKLFKNCKNVMKAWRPDTLKLLISSKVSKCDESVSRNTQISQLYKNCQNVMKECLEFRITKLSQFSKNGKMWWKYVWRSETLKLLNSSIPHWTTYNHWPIRFQYFSIMYCTLWGIHYHTIMVSWRPIRLLDFNWERYNEVLCSNIYVFMYIHYDYTNDVYMHFELDNSVIVMMIYFY